METTLTPCVELVRTLPLTRQGLCFGVQDPETDAQIQKRPEIRRSRAPLRTPTLGPVTALNQNGVCGGAAREGAGWQHKCL